MTTDGIERPDISGISRTRVSTETFKASQSISLLVTPLAPEIGYTYWAMTMSWICLEENFELAPFSTPSTDDIERHAGGVSLNG